MRIRLLVIGVFLLAFTLASPEASRASIASHGGQDNCFFCHNMHGAGTGQLINSPVSAESLCLSCHGAAGISTLKADVHNGTTYGSFSYTCQVCHSSHEYRVNWDGGYNLKTIGRDSGDDAPPLAANAYIVNIPGNGGVANVVFESRGTDATPADTFYNSFADDDYDGDSVYEGVCEICHTQTDFHRNNATGDHVHNVGKQCTVCHKHDNYFKGEGACVDCHNKSVGSAPDIFRKVTGTGGDFDNTSRHVFNSGGDDPMNWDCIVCHAEGDINSSITNIATSTEHNDTGKTIAMRNVDSAGNPGVANTNFWRWPKPSASRTDADYDRMDMFCMSCHDSDASRGAGLGGASGLAVNAASDGVNTSPTLAERTKPFSAIDNLDLNGYDAGSVTPDAAHNETGGLVVDYDTQAECEAIPHGNFVWIAASSKCIIPRDSVVDAYGQFDTTNPSHHAVRGQRYTTNLDSGWICVQPSATGNSSCDDRWSNSTKICYIDSQTTKAGCEGAGYSWWGDWAGQTWGALTLKDGTSLQTVRETATLHCADCHTVDDNTHGSSFNNYMLTNIAGSATIDGHCYTCHDSDVYSATARYGSRKNHNDDTNIWGDDGSKLDSDPVGGFCLVCHGGAHYDGYGAIHGIANSTNGDDRLYYETQGDATPIRQDRYRFIGGSTMSTYFAGDDWETGGTATTCYFMNDDPQPWAYCAHHGTGTSAGEDTLYDKPLNY